MVIEYNNNSQSKNKEADKQEIEKYRKFIQDLPTSSISLSDLQNNDTPNSPQNNSEANPNSNNKVVGAGIVILVGILVYVALKKEKTNR